MVLRDSLGVPLEPEEPKVVLNDCYGDPIYRGDVYYIFDDDVYEPDNLNDFFDHIAHSLTPEDKFEILSQSYDESEYICVDDYVLNEMVREELYKDAIKKIAE